MEKTDQNLAEMKNAPQAVAPQAAAMPQPTINNKEQSDRKDDSLERGAVNRVLRWIAYPLAAVGGWAATYISVRETAYHSAKESNPEIGKLKQDFINTNQENLQLLRSPDSTKHITQETFVERKRAARKVLSEGIQHEMEFMGLGTFREKWANINLHNKTKAVIDGATVAGITIGALLTIAQSKTLSRLFSDTKEPER